MKNKILACLLCGFLAAFVIFLRFHLISMPQLETFAKAEVYNEIKNKARESIEKEYTEFPAEKKEELARRAYKQYLQENRYVVDEKIRAKAAEKKAFYQNENGATYLFGIDSYYWLRLIDNLIKKGHIGDRIVAGKQHDDLVDMPIEDSLSRSMHLKVGELFYGAFGIFGKHPDYERGLFFIPLFFSGALVLATFFVTRLLCSSDSAAFFSSLAVNLSPLLLNRTMGEWLDTDMYNIFFPLAIFGSFLFVFKSVGTKRKVAATILFALSCALYASIWQGWWFIFDILMLCGCVFFFNDYYTEERDTALLKTNLKWLLLLFVSGFLSVALLNGRESLFSFLIEPGKLFFALKDVPRSNWPNVFLTVAELKKVSAQRIAFEVGGVPLFFFTIVGSIYLILVKKVMRDRQLGIGFFCLFIWLGLMYYTSLRAIRFALLLIVPLGIMFGIIFDRLLVFIFNRSRAFPKKIRFCLWAVIVGLAGRVIIFYLSTSFMLAGARLPMINDAWVKSLAFIREHSDETATINSWWDYGHWYTALADRRVLFDGKTQNSPVAYWVARVLLTDNEDEAVGILRMLNLSKNKAFDLLSTSGISHVRSMEILRHLALLPKEEDARQYLKDTLEPEVIDKLVNLLYSKELPTVYFIASYDMLAKLSAISFIGNWDFQRGDIWVALKERRPFAFMEYLQRQYGYDKKQAQDLFKKVAFLKEEEATSWISSVNGISLDSFSSKYSRDGSLLFFDNGIVIDLDSLKAHIFTGRNKEIGIPYSIVYVNNGVLEEKVLEASNIPHSVLLLSEENKDSYRTIFVDKNVARSMFVRMYFYGGKGLRYFTKAHEEKTTEGNSIYTYEIKWP